MLQERRPIKELDLSRNQLGDTAAVQFGEALGREFSVLSGCSLAGLPCWWVGCWVGCSLTGLLSWWTGWWVAGSLVSWLAGRLAGILAGGWLVGWLVS